MITADSERDRAGFGNLTRNAADVFGIKTVVLPGDREAGRDTQPAGLGMGVHVAGFAAVFGFAGWLDKQSAELPGLEGIRKLHKEIHEIAVEIDKLHRTNQRDQIPTLMNALDVLSDQLSHEMETLMEHIA